MDDDSFFEDVPYKPESTEAKDRRKTLTLVEEQPTLFRKNSKPLDIPYLPSTVSPDRMSEFHGKKSKANEKAKTHKKSRKKKSLANYTDMNRPFILGKSKILPREVKRHDQATQGYLSTTGIILEEPSRRVGDLLVDIPDLSVSRKEAPLINLLDSYSCSAQTLEEFCNSAADTGQKDHEVEALVNKGLGGIAKGYKPFKVEGGSSGTYYLRDEKGRFAGIFKPEDEEVTTFERSKTRTDLFNSVRGGIRSGEGASREVAAYILDHNGFSGVPPTALVQLYSKEFLVEVMPNSPRQHHRVSCFTSRSKSVDATSYDRDLNYWKTGSLQAYTSHNSSAEDVGVNIFPTDEVQKIGILDIRLLNTDRHSGNILINFVGGGEKRVVKMVPIDHGLCLPEFASIDNDLRFIWMEWPQSKEPFNEKTLNYIQSLDIEKDIRLLKAMQGKISEESLLTLLIGHMLLKVGAEKGRTLYDIGSIICGNFYETCYEGETSFSDIPKSSLNQLISMSEFISFESGQLTEFLERFECNLSNFMEDEQNFKDFQI